MQERQILGTAVGFPDAMRFKGAAPEIINSRYSAFVACHAEASARRRGHCMLWHVSSFCIIFDIAKICMASALSSTLLPVSELALLHDL